MRQLHTKPVIAILAGLLLLAGVVLYVRKELQLQRQVRTTARIIDFRTKRANNRYSHFPIIEFNDAEGRRITRESHMGSSQRIGSVGDEVQVYFDPEHPAKVTIDLFFQKHFVAAISVFMGVGLFLITRIRTAETEELADRSSARKVVHNAQSSP